MTIQDILNNLDEKIDALIKSYLFGNKAIILDCLEKQEKTEILESYKIIEKNKSDNYL